MQDEALSPPISGAGGAPHVSATPIALPTGEEGPRVDAPCGPVRGVWRRIVSAPGARSPHARFERSAAFYNIPYAEPPVAGRRFMAPVPRARWREEREAVLPGPTPQRGSIFDDPAIPEPTVVGEDMLNLNIFTPAPGDAGAGLPVYVWIHGGGWSSGCQASPWYDGAAFNRDGVVTVALSYRLGFDGYGWVEGSDTPFNRGVLDQITALEWVRDNIAAFGGDAGRVTIGGQSAGGGNVLTLMACPRARGLFHGAISESGAVTDVPADRARSTAHEMARFAGVEPNLEGWRALDYDRVFSTTAGFERQIERRVEGHCAEPAAPDPLVGRIRAALIPGPDTGIIYGPAVDGDLVPLPVREALARGSGGDIPLLAMSTTHEFIWSAFGLAQELGERSAAEIMTRAGLDAGLAADYVASHPELAGGEHLRLGNLISDTMFHTPLLGWARARLDCAGPDARAAGTWLSRFAWESPETGWSTHCFEVPFAFDCLAHPYCGHTLRSAPPQALADAVHGDWVRFILAGDPGWRPWDGRGLGRTYGDPRGAWPDGAVDGEVFAVEQRLLEAGERLAEAAPREG
ncbi:carboxylesterase/lipase family protein [Actinomyces israelii]|uniref:carboxylesterase/lipase family protein n=1 Tax=Actinomyces israelii TaxID=1659 RepID=UPI0025571B5A|nr:carboxylesterase family protein [Actinomyces israelii]WKR21056.1 Carboxylesterase [Actinomyces israelii]